MIVNTINVFAGKSHLTCSKNGTVLFYINGVGLKDDDKSFSSNTNIVTQQVIKSNVDSKSTIISNYMPNRSEGILKDVSEAYFLYMNSTKISEANPTLKADAYKLFVSYFTSNRVKFKLMCAAKESLRKYCNEIKKIAALKEKSATVKDLRLFTEKTIDFLNENRKVIFVTHSSGALFADRIRDVLAEHPSYKKNMVSHVALARPLSAERTKNRYDIVFNTDSLINYIRKNNLDAPDSNVDLIGDCPNNEPMPLPDTDIIVRNHEFSCYIGQNLVEGKQFFPKTNMTALEYVADSIYRVASELGNNDELCCNKSAYGKLWINEDDSLGGFVSDNTKIQYNVILEPGSQICGKGTIKGRVGSNPSILKNKVKLKGSYDISGYFNIQELLTSENSKITLNTSSTSESKIQKLNLVGNFSVSGRFKFEDVTVSGNVSINSPVNTLIDVSGSNIKTVTYGKMNILQGIYMTSSDLVDVDFEVTSGVNLHNFKALKGFSAASPILGMAVYNTTFKENASFTSNDQITFYSTGSTIDKEFEYPGSMLSLNTVNITEEQDWGNSDRVYLTKLNLGSGNQFSSSYQIQSLKSTQSNMTNTIINGRSSEMDFLLNAFSDLTNLTVLSGTEKIFLGGTIGSNVTIHDDVRVSGDDTLVIASNTTILGPNFFHCSVSGTIPANYICP